MFVFFFLEGFPVVDGLAVPPAQPLGALVAVEPQLVVGGAPAVRGTPGDLWSKPPPN